MSQPIWNTISSNLVGFVSGSVLEFQFSASPVLPATTVTYSLLSGSLPNGVTIDETGLMYGLTEPVFTNQNYTFAVRATDNLGNLRDKTFTMLVSGIDAPNFTTPAGTIIVTNDSLWVEYPIEYSVPINDTSVLIALVQGQLPPGLEINEYGLIRGYPKPPIVNVNLGSVNTAAIATLDNTIVAYSTLGFRPGRPISFTNSVIGGIVAGQNYYVREVINNTTFTISTTVGGPVVVLANAVGYMDVSLPNVSVGEPTIQTYDFTLRLVSAFGTALQSYSITVVNQNAPINIGGPGRPPNSRTPTILNTRPLTYDIRYDNLDYSFYLFPPNSNGRTYSPSQFAYIGKLNSDNEFAFQMLGKDFDDSELEYVFADLPLGLVGNSVSGWVTGNPTISPDNLSEFSFSVAVRKVSNPGIISPFFNFSFRVSNGVDGDIVWITSSDLGTVFNGTTSVLAVRAESDVPLEYELSSGTLPPNLILLPSGEISGVVSFQPNATITYPNETTTFTFTIRAYSPNFPIIAAEQTFTVNVNQLFAYPTDTLYIKCSPSIEDRELLDTLLDNSALIPNEYIYRPNDPYFGKATSVIYEHAYGIRASDFEEYVAAIQEKNHYWRQLTLGEIKTAVARNEQTGEIIYEVVYSSIIDNLINPEGESVSKEIFWPRFIPLELGPWYTSETDIYTSYEGPDGPPPEFYTSLTPGFERILYPNSLPNMREQVGDELGQEFNTNLLPLWMTSQQANGSTLGYTPAWVICYTKPGFSEIVKNNINNNWKNPIGQIQRLNQINFKIDRFTVNKSNTYNYDNNLSPPAWTSLPSATPVPSPLDSKDFYVLFPRPTILPNRTQYPR
jgi:hypothetical protein